MDFLKTLLAYMTLLATLGVQEGPMPQSVPTPTPLPPHVTATLVPHQTEAPTATPSPTPQPVPTITPNYRYESIDFGDSGNAVRKLQNKLIELGYMPKGSADGAYGYQTYNAVKAFQKANGLSADGVAGPATLTNLYENPDVLPAVVQTAVPTATPTPTLPPVPTMTPPPPVTQAPVQPAATEVFTQAPATDAPAVSGTSAWKKLAGGYIISGNTGSALYIQQTINGQQALVKPDLWLSPNGDAIVSLSQLADCLGWTLMGSSADQAYTLRACGYDVAIHLTSEALIVTVDGEAVTLSRSDVLLVDGTLYITDKFLAEALDASVVFDVDESSLVLFLTDKSVADAQD